MLINTSSLLNFLQVSLNDNIINKIESFSKNGKVDISDLLKDKSISKLIESLFKDVFLGLKTKTSINKSLISNKAIFDFKSVSSDIKDIIKLIQNNSKLETQVKVLKNFLIDIKQIDDKNLKMNINNSGIFLESKLLRNSPNITSDLKAVLLQVQEQLNDPKVQKTIQQIEYHQLLSMTSFSSNTFLPFIWDNIDDANININNSNDDNFTCTIDLNLKKYGELKVILLLEKNNILNINLRVQSDMLKKTIQDNLSILRKKINNIGLNLQSLNVLKYNDRKTYEQKAYDGFNQLELGIDIKA